MPTSEPGVVNYVGECSNGDGDDDYLCGECEGGCDNDSDCEDGLWCMQRSGFEIVPGCSGAGGLRDVFGKNMCYKPAKKNEVRLVGNPCTDFFESGYCEECSGDCDNDVDCDGDLRCVQRIGDQKEVENVPGCIWREGSEDLQFGSTDFCEYVISTSRRLFILWLSLLSSISSRYIFTLSGFMPDYDVSGVVNYVGECGRDYLCGECEGNCDDDYDCEDGLQCFDRSGFEDVPGCTGEGGDRDVYGKGICFKPKLPEYLDS